jgi:uncharacterized iron-regulated protein
MYRIASVLGCLLFCAAAAPACAPKEGNASASPSAPTQPGTAPFKWKTSIAKDHPLAGRFYDATTFREVKEEEVLDACAQATYVLLGEKHDNPDHHTEQARILGGMVTKKRSPAVVLEMIETDMAERLAGYMDRSGASAADFGDAMEWEKRGWGPWEGYRPIMDVSFAAKLPLVAGGIPQVRASGIAHHGEAAVDAEDRKTYLLDETMAPELESSLHDELVKAHCGHLPSTMVRGMFLAERARDAGMANAMAPYEGRGAVLIAGNGHARKDRGVPWALARKAPHAKVTTVAMIEVEDDRTNPKAYDIHADYTFFTPRATDEDPCIAFKEEMKKRKR